MSRPNILFLMSDEHRPDVTGYEGDPVIRSPTLDFLAETGVVFRSAYTPAPICIPARQCMMAGQLPHTCGCRRFGDDLPPFSMTFAKRFAQHAYQTVCAGKLHHTGADQMQGWKRRLAGDTAVTDRHLDGRVEEAFEGLHPEPGTGKWSRSKEIARAGIGYGHLQREDDWAAAATRGLMRDYFVDPMYDRPQRHRPLFAKCSLVQPHYPFFTDEARFTHYFNRVPLLGGAKHDHPVLGLSQGNEDVEATERDRRRATAAYYGMVEACDRHCGDVIEAMRHVGEDPDDWIIVYTSDHGEMLGEHGLWEKARFFEASARVPLIVRWPRAFGPGAVDENVNLCDLFATLCDLAGIDPPADEETVHGAGLDSRSLVPLLEGRAADWRAAHGNETISELGEHVMIKRDALKYQHYGPDGPEVLFHLEADPGETRNHIDDPAYADAVDAFRRRRRELGIG